MISQFEWNQEKARCNFEKHGVTFSEGATIFSDQRIATMLDPDHSQDEERSIAIGVSVKGRILIVVFTDRGNKIRLISCRKATSTERKTYEEDEWF